MKRMIDNIPMQGRYTRLRPVDAGFTEELYELAATNQIPWRYSAVETPDGFRESFWLGVLVQFAVQDVRSRRDVALVRADNANLYAGHAYVTMMMHPDFRMRAWPLEGALLFGNYLFTKYNFHHLYAETPESHLEQFKSGAGAMFEVEGQLREFVIINGRREDLYILAFTRERWLAEGVPAIERCTRPPGTRARVD